MTDHDKKKLLDEQSVCVPTEEVVDQACLELSPLIQRKLSALAARTHDVLLEIGTEELPVHSIETLAQSLGHCLMQASQDAGLIFGDLDYYGSPRRLAVILHDLSTMQPDQIEDHRGPRREQAFDDNQQPTPALLGFARRFGLSEDDLKALIHQARSSEAVHRSKDGSIGFTKTNKGEFIVLRRKIKGQPTSLLLPNLVEQAVAKVCLARSMRWGEAPIEFIRPVRWVTLLYGETEIKTNVLGLRSSRVTYGHRFHHPQPIPLAHPSEYVKKLREVGYVEVDSQARRQSIQQQAQALVSRIKGAEVVFETDLLNEVVGLVEYPQVLIGQFDTRFLDLPEEVLISVMRTHQRCFYVRQGGQLSSYFVIVSNIRSRASEGIIEGNRRVMQARLADAEFFFQMDCQHDLEHALERLKQVSFQEGLGSLYDKALRLSGLSEKIAKAIHSPDATLAARAGLLAKSDLLTYLVQEFPELNGVMGYYYAKRYHEHDSVAGAIKEHYCPHSAYSAIPSSELGRVLAIAERLDTLVGLVGIHQLPTGDKDPLALRRAALGLLRIMIEGQLALDLRVLIQWSVASYTVNLPNKQVEQDVLQFVLERLRTFYLDKNVDPSVFDAVFADRPSAALDFHKRIEAMDQFYRLDAAQALIKAHKRVNSFLKKADPHHDQQTTVEAVINPDLLELSEEKALVNALKEKTQIFDQFYKEGLYVKALLSLAELQTVVDCFFDKVLIMAESSALQANRFAILTRLNTLFNKVGDISLLKKDQ